MPCNDNIISKNIIAKNDSLSYFLKSTGCSYEFVLKAITNMSTSLAIFLGDLNKNLYYASDNFVECFGLESNIISSFPRVWSEFIYGDKYKKAFLEDISELIGGSKEVSDLSYPVKCYGGDVFWVRSFISVLRDKNNKATSIAGRLIKEGDSLPVSQLSRLPLISAFRSRLELYRKYKGSCFTIGINLRHINKINIEYGREVGDAIIKQVVDECLNLHLTKITSYSISEVKYVAIVEYAAADEIQGIIQDITLVVDRVYRKHGIEVDRPASFVVMKYSYDKSSVDDFIENLLILIRESENDTSGRYIINTDEYIDRIHSNAKMILALNKDVINSMNNFKINIQPIVARVDKKIIGGECLLRWSYNGDNISPAVFIPLLEDNNLISVVGKWVIEQAIEVLKPIVRLNPNFYLTVNISKKQLKDDSFYDFIPKIINQDGIDAKNITLEITESTVEQRAESLSRLVELCKKLNISLAIDDFGTGYSNLFSLLEISYDILKIDRTMLLELEKLERNVEFVSGLLQACRSHRIKICVEGVETDNQLRIADALAADMLQGYYYYRPLEADKMLELVAKDK